MILCCGDTLMDMIPGRTASGQMGYVPHNGGGAVNTALNLARMGARVGLLAAVSRDPFGRQLVRALRNGGVDTSLIIASDQPCTLAFVHLTDGEAQYSFYDENSAARTLAPTDLPVLPDHVRSLLLGGICLCHTPGAAAFEALGQNAGKRLVMLDPNVRPGFVGDEVAYRARLGRMMARAHIVKLSEPDLDWIDPRPLDWQDKLAELLRTGPSLVLFTQGEKGATACHRDGRKVTVEAEKVEVVDSVGAGDAFNAGFLARLHALDLADPKAVATMPTEFLRDCLAHATRAAAASLSRSGGV